MKGSEALAEGAGKLLGAAPELYNDLGKPVVQEAGKMLALPLQAVNALLVRPRSWIANANYKLQETNALIANRLKYKQVGFPSRFCCCSCFTSLVVFYGQQ